MKLLLTLAAYILLLQGCSWIQGSPDSDRKAQCQQLGYRMTYYTMTSNQQEAMSQRAQMDNLQKTYRELGC